MGAQPNLDVFATLAEAVGLTRDGDLQGQWFQDPLGRPDGTRRGLSSMMYRDDQRDALIEFVDDVLGGAERDSVGDAIWVPLFNDAGATIFVVVQEASDRVLVGFGIEYESGGQAPSVAVRAHVPVFQFERQTTVPSDPLGTGADPEWLALGQSGANIDISLEVGISVEAPAPGELFIGGVYLGLHLPTDPSDDLTFSVGFRRLQLPGSSAPKDFDLTVDSIDELGADFLEFMTGLIQAQAEALDSTNPATAPFAALTGLAGLRAVNNIPAFPLEQLISSGIPAVTHWLESILLNTDSRNAWLGQWAELLGGAINTTRSSIEFSNGQLTGSVGLRMQSSSGGGLIVTPWMEGSLRPQSGAEVNAHLDLLTLQTLASSVTALPNLSLSAVFGQEAGLGSGLLTGDPGLGSVKVGLVLSDGRPAFALTAHDVTLGGVSHELLDLSSPEAALDAADGVVDTALVAALNSLGRPGEISALVLGLDPPAGISGPSAIDLLTDPLGRISGYWNSLRGSSASMNLVLTAIQELITGSSTPVSVSGTSENPWQINLDPVNFLVALDGDWVHFDLQASVEQGVFEGKAAEVFVEARLLKVNFSSPAVEFFSQVKAGARLRESGEDTLRLDLGPIDLLTRSMGVALGWTASGGLNAKVEAPELRVELESAQDSISSTVSIPVPLPEFHNDGSVTFAPDWAAIEQAIAALLLRMESPIINVGLDLAGWSGSGARLSLATLLSDPKSALESWLGSLVLNCDHVREAMVPLAYLLSGFRQKAPLGTGNERTPFRAAIAAEAQAPGIAVWLDPGCAIPHGRYEPAAGYFDYSEAPEPSTMAAALKSAGAALPDLDDLMTGRNSLGDGFQALLDRLTGTDGLLGRPASLPDGVNGVDIPGLSYRELVAYGVLNLLPQEAAGIAPDSVLYVGCEDIWADCFGTDSFDARTASGNPVIPASAQGRWSICLPGFAAAASARPDRGAVEEQAHRLITVLEDRLEPVTVVAFGAAGAAVIRAANSIANIEHVITVGTPWSPVSLNGLTSGLSGDALRVIELIRRPNEETLAEEEIAGESGPVLQFGYVIDRAVTAAGFTAEQLGELPRADEQTRRTGMPVNAVFGSLDADTLETGMAALIADAIEYRYEQFETPETPPQKLHLGVDLPVFDADLGGVLVGAGAILELATCDRGESGDGFAVQTERQLIVDLHFGVHDGWLIGGPGAEQADIEVRWISVRLYLPLQGSARVSGARITLHEANCFGVRKERWVIQNGADLADAILPTPEIHLIMAEVVSRLSSASSSLSQLLADVGLVQSGGYNPEGLDELIVDAGSAVSAALGSSSESMANAVRALGGFSGTGAEISWAIDAANITVNLDTRNIRVSVEHIAGDLAPISLSVAVSAASASLSAGLGQIREDAGGIRLTGGAETGSAAANLGIEWRLPGAPATRTINLLAPTQLDELARLGASLIPATLVAGFADHLRDKASENARQAIDALLSSLDLLAPASELATQRILLPWALFLDPVSWLKFGTRQWALDPFGQAVQTLNALGQLLIPGFSGDGYELSNEVAVGYGVNDGRLELAVNVEARHALGPTPVSISVAGGLSITTSGSVAPTMATTVSFDGKGLALTVSPDVRIDLIRAAPAAPMPVYPSGPGIGALLSTGAGMAIPVVLNALIAERNDPAPSLTKDVAAAIYELGSALDLLESDQFADASIQVFAANPAGVLLARLPNLVVSAVDQLANALDPSSTFISASSVGPGISRLALGSSDPVAITLDASGSGPAIEVSAFLTITDVGTIGFEKIRLSESGVQVSVSYTASGFDLGNGLILRPVARVDAGISGSGFQRLAAIGLATDGVGDQSVQFRWALNQTPPRMALVAKSATGETENTDPASVALALLSQAISMAAGVTLDAMGTLGSDTVDALQNVLFTGNSATLDPTLFDDFSNADRMLQRLFQLGFNLADKNLKITIDNKIEVGFTLNGNQVGVFLSLPEGERIALNSSDPTVDLEVVANWINSPGIAPGLSIFLLEKVDERLELNAGFSLAGLGVRVGKNSGPLLNLGIMSIDAIGVHIYGEATSAGPGGGVQVQLDGLAIVPSAAGGDNAVANTIMSDAGNDASPAARPAFSPSLAIQKPPGQGLGISLSAGDQPGPWWLTIQRQLGPLYLEQFGFDVAEANGTVTGISLLFDARISLFGLTASVDELGLHWLGGDLFELNNWAVDLQGLGVAGDFSGLSISGGLLKTELDGKIGYLGMLSGRFGVYGLSLFGGYNEDNGLPSFFVFGAIQGPIGGPPAFFLTGIGGGLGIKRGLRVPDDLSKFGEYPFIKALDPSASASSDPLEELRQLAAYFPPEPGNFWFAAGISFTSFSLVDGVAVLSVSIGNGLELNLFGLARLALPRPQAALVSIELGLLARFSSSEGLFLIQAQLTDNSWLLYPEVRLTGGFAFATWWLGPNAGQFVLTLGGYHPSFHRDGYPVVPRLGLQWRVTDEIVIKGEAYFALTSEALMAGIDVEVSADFGWAWARIAFGAYAIVYFDPFYFQAGAYARISAGVRIKTWFGTIRISVSLGAQIQVEGPDFKGRATLEIGPCDFTVRFGGSREIREPFIVWDDFVAKYLEEAGSGRARTLSGISGKGSLPASTDGANSAPSSDGSLAKPFEVFAEFEVSIVASAPITEFDFGDSEGFFEVDGLRVNKVISPKLPDSTIVTMGISPMNATGLKGTLKVRLSRWDGEDWIDETLRLRPLVKGMVDEKVSKEGPTYGMEAFPIGVWGTAEDHESSTSALPKGDVIFAGSRLKLVAAADMSTQTGPEIDYYRVETGRRLLPLSATGNRRQNNIDRGASMGLSANVNSVSDAFNEARKYLFAEGVREVPEGLLAVGSRSTKSQAIYESSRTAPPMFGSLMDGLEPFNAENASVSVMATGATVAPRKPARPFVTGVMTSGAGVALRAVTTSVSDGRIKRRPAPSIESVRGRLGRSLPIKLNLTHAPSRMSNETVVLRGSLPHTSIAGLSQTYLGDRVGSGAGTGYVKGLASGPAPQAPQTSLRPGDFVTMRCPDAAIDTGTARPHLRISGFARVVMLLGNGAVLHDTTLQDSKLEVPAQTSLIAVQASGGGDGRATGLQVQGWHDQSRLIRLSGRSALGAGCVLILNGTKGRTRIGWNIAQDIVRGAASVSTCFGSHVTCIGVVLKGASSNALNDVEVELYGATHRTEPVEPIVVQAGARSILLFDVIPDGKSPGISVRVIQGGAKEIAGMIAAVSDADSLAELVAEKGLPVTVSRLRAVSDKSCDIEWIPVEE
ncbi:DUF6603 domain-containing protein [Marinobacter sp. 1_MG-2023]|uniref:DUF6603 domain-containing protein n=1 Tax=Marinobacter sp. 1_MG-2023 TaxID=3062627 RepID=UPI0026E296DE|nr:DUF6603 domain-containing protein [Marinobacter sp. 1_MG-2023]MDO6824394.1 hypothetical protein [Marinobacter sp. 1_MG-2023]